MKHLIKSHKIQNVSLGGEIFFQSSENIMHMFNLSISWVWDACAEVYCVFFGSPWFCWSWFSIPVP